MHYFYHYICDCDNYCHHQHEKHLNYLYHYKYHIQVYKIACIIENLYYFLLSQCIGNDYSSNKRNTIILIIIKTNKITFRFSRRTESKWGRDRGRDTWNDWYEKADELAFSNVLFCATSWWNTSVRCWYLNPRIFPPNYHLIIHNHLLCNNWWLLYIYLITLVNRLHPMIFRIIFYFFNQNFFFLISIILIAFFGIFFKIIWNGNRKNII